ncbi:MAG: NAD-glutamate dehydrogenase domain-containing protein, partial [Halopseudomonas sp.]
MFDTRQLKTTLVLDQLAELIRRRQPAHQVDSLVAFARDYLADRLTESLADSELDDVYTNLLSCWRFIERQQASQVKTPQWEQSLGNSALAYRGAFPSAYRDHFSTATAQQDIELLDQLSGSDAISCGFSDSSDQTPGRLHFKLYTTQDSLVLSDVVPILENLGMKVVGEHPYAINRADGQSFWIHDYTLAFHDQDYDYLQNPSSLALDADGLHQLFQHAFINTWHNQADNDPFNKLVMKAGLGWREVAMLRAYARYFRQSRFGFSQPFIAESLTKHIAITRMLVAMFQIRFDPADQQDVTATQALEAAIREALEAIESLDEDKILSRYLELINATLRTNFYQQDRSGSLKAYFAFKLDPEAISDLPLPRPKYEVFIYSPRVEGVHLRAGKVARGGLRWSDRMEDYRTEVLGLVKAQQVKNSVIVPMGAKGCFIAKQLPVNGDREQIQAEGIACYQIYIRGLLDITDNLVDGSVVPPRGVVVHDSEDPYLVVAADKGTATFSDIANAIAEEYGFWLGDAFASGGSEGYDHKKMGITARGAWESVKRHFRERDLNTQTHSFTVVGIGDMAGDVFGNGMLLSESIQLVAAFNHQHIFIDPNPDCATSFAERKRLFELPRSSWSDYASELISQGGGVFSRRAKSITLTAEMKRRFAIDADRLAPDALINALLKAPVDMLWNGGIGTYVKASNEAHSDVGDKTNDNLRINGNELRCEVLGEGGNLGFTQLGRIEFGLQGGASNTDFIDNAGGVDCSDHEVNIKILLNEQVAQGSITLAQRNQLLRQMTDQVAQLVLKNNYRQVQALSIAESHARKSIDEYIHLIDSMEASGKLNRELEFLPSRQQLLERRELGDGLTRPELSVLIGYTKIELKQALINSWITDDPYLAREMDSAFPARLLEAFPDAVRNHRLRREITATQIANDLVNRMGITYVHHLRQATGADHAQIAAAYLIAREVYGIDARWNAIES